MDALWTHLEGSHSDITLATGSDEIITVNIGGTWSSADTTYFMMHYVTTGPSNYIQFNCNSPARHAGVYSTSKYRLSIANGVALTFSAANHVRFNGLIIEVSSGNGNYQNPIEFSSMSAGARIDFVNCIIKGHGADYVSSFLGGVDFGGTVNVINCILYGLSTVNSGTTGIKNSGATLNVYSTVMIGGMVGFNHNSGTSVFKNVYIGGTGYQDFWTSAENGTFDKTNCASEDLTGDDAGGVTSATNCITGVACSVATFTNVTGGSEDFHIVSGSGLRDVGVTTSAEGAPFNFTTDIDGDTRSGTWDIGADEYVASGLNDVTRPLTGVSG